jgi:hypothetical protein
VASTPGCRVSHLGSIPSPYVFHTWEQEFNHKVISLLEWSLTAHTSILIGGVPCNKVWRETIYLIASILIVYIILIFWVVSYKMTFTTHGKFLLYK